MLAAELSRVTPMQRAAGVGRLVAKQRLGRTCIGRLYQEGAAKIRLPDRADGGFEAVLINTAGGLTGGDRMHWRIDVEAEADVTVTTQACEKIYASSGGTASVSTEITVGKSTRIAWLPQETILFDHAQLSRRLEVELDGDAEALIVEPVALGRLAMGEKRISGNFRDRWRIRQQGRLIHAEDFRIGADIWQAAEKQAVLGGAGAFATVLLISKDGEKFIEKARCIIGSGGAVSFWDGKLLARLVAEDAYTLRKRLVPLINLLNREAVLPKCWSL